MAERIIPPLFQMPDAMKKQLTDLQTQISSARTSIEALRKIGMDVSMIEEKLVWAEETRKTLLTTFAPKEK
jgi:hypothetical protein